MLTTKKQPRKTKFLRTREVIDRETGEIIPMQEVSVEDRDFNFHKLWLGNLIASLEEITNQKQKLTFWIVDNLNRENQLIKTQRQIAQESGVSYQTVNRTIKILLQSNFLAKLNSGAYIVNPDIIWRGSHNTRMGTIYTYYNNVQPPTEPAEAEERRGENGN